jgi:DNA polymerase-1
MLVNKSLASPNMDVHTATAAKMFGLTPKKVTPELRRAAKRASFSSLYGCSMKKVYAEIYGLQR